MDAVKDNGFAYLSDYYRLKVLYEYGGIYLGKPLLYRIAI